jgi:hypothetical protein
MAKDFSICVGTIGSGAWLSPDGGETWRIHRNPRLGLGAELKKRGHAKKRFNAKDAKEARRTRRARCLRGLCVSLASSALTTLVLKTRQHARRCRRARKTL